jgi:hypothetical protein
LRAGVNGIIIRAVREARRLLDEGLHVKGDLPTGGTPNWNWPKGAEWWLYVGSRKRAFGRRKLAGRGQAPLPASSLHDRRHSEVVGPAKPSLGRTVQVREPAIDRAHLLRAYKQVTARRHISQTRTR